jgi:hypothetical protein
MMKNLSVILKPILFFLQFFLSISSSNRLSDASKNNQELHHNFAPVVKTSFKAPIKSQDEENLDIRLFLINAQERAEKSIMKR